MVTIEQLKTEKEECDKKLYDMRLQDLDLGQEFDIGEEVWSNGDEKKPEMLIKITGKKINPLNKRVIYRCEYIDKEYLAKLGWKKKTFFNAGRFLRSQKFPYGLTTIQENELKATSLALSKGIEVAEKQKEMFEELLRKKLKQLDFYYNDSKDLRDRTYERGGYDAVNNLLKELAEQLEVKDEK
jgi:hypothetical protein